MRLSFVPSISISGRFESGQLVEVEAARGLGLTEIVPIKVDGVPSEASGTDLRAALLSTTHSLTETIRYIGAERCGVQLDSLGRSSSMAHLDAEGPRQPMYWLYMRHAGEVPRLTRWKRAGYVSQASLLAQTDGYYASDAAAKRALSKALQWGLPSPLEVTLHSPDSKETGKVTAPEGGWLDIEPGALVRTAALPIHAVDDLGEWPGPVTLKLEE
jgi:hypothetical protein